jgi:hypothetical protein
MGTKALWLIVAACFLEWETVAVPDETIGVSAPASVHQNRGID